MQPGTPKRFIIGLLLRLLKYDEEHTHLVDLFVRWPFIERRSETARYHLIGDEREPETPVLTPRLVLTIAICAAVVVGVSLAYVAAGWSGALLLIPIFVAYSYFVLFARALALRLRRLFA